MSYHVENYTKTLLGTFESDTEACFDRLVMAFVFTYFLVLGALLPAVKTWESVLKNIVHYVQTGFGVSKDSYGYTDQDLIIRPGQGSTGSPSSFPTMVYWQLKN